MTNINNFKQQILYALKGKDDETSDDVKIIEYNPIDYGDNNTWVIEEEIKAYASYNGFLIEICLFSFLNKKEKYAQEITNEYNLSDGITSPKIGTSCTQYNKELVNDEEVIWALLEESGVLNDIDEFEVCLTNFACKSSVIPLIMCIQTSHYLPLIIGFFGICYVVWFGLIKPIIKGTATSKYTTKWHKNPVQINSKK